MRWLPLFAAFLTFGTGLARAQDAELVAKQKAAAIAYLGKCDVANPVVIETENLLVTGDLPENKLKPLAVYTQKQFAAALKALRFEMTDNPPKGKLAVYFFPERRKFALLVGELVQERIDREDRAIMNARANEPYVAISAALGDKPNDLDVEAANQIALALLACKAGPAMLPSWMKAGFSKAMMWRLDPVSGNKEKLLVRKMMLLTKDDPAKRGVKIPAWKSADIWTGTFDDDRKLLAASLMDYLVHGPDAGKFSKIIGNFRPSDEVREPTLLTALAATEIKVDDLEKAWRRWALTGR